MYVTLPYCNLERWNVESLGDWITHANNILHLKEGLR